MERKSNEEVDEELINPTVKEVQAPLNEVKSGRQHFFN